MAKETEPKDNLDKALELLEDQLRSINEEIKKATAPFIEKQASIKEKIALLKEIKNGTFTGPVQPVKRTRQKRS